MSEGDQQDKQFSKEKSRIDEVHLVCYHTKFWNSEVSCKVREKVGVSMNGTGVCTNVGRVIRDIVHDLPLMAGNEGEKILLTTVAYTN